MTARAGQRYMIISSAATRFQISPFRSVNGIDGVQLKLALSGNAETLIPNMEEKNACSARDRILPKHSAAAVPKGAIARTVKSHHTEALLTTFSITNSLPSSLTMSPTSLSSQNGSNLFAKSSSSSSSCASTTPLYLAPTLWTGIPHMSRNYVGGNKGRYFSSSPGSRLRKQRSSRVASFFIPPLCPSPWSPTDSADFSTDSATITVTEKPPIQTHQLGYHVSAAFSAKSEKMKDPYYFTYSPYNNVCKNRKLPLAERKRARLPSGQDAFFISRVQEQGGVALGVADGVGGYSSVGIDSADFSHELCEIMACMAQSAPMKLMHPRTLLNAAYVKLIEDQEVIGGASTVCVGVATPDGVLTVANLGDSGYVIFRDGKVVHTSTPQTYSFNTPYQLSLISPKLLEKTLTFGGDFLCNLPKDANVTMHGLVHGDVVIFATDGLWDNLFTHQILKIVCQEMIAHNGWIHGGNSAPTESELRRRGIHPSNKLAELTEHDGAGLQTIVANAIAAKAKSMSLNNRIDGPFAKEAKRVMPYMWHSGGKCDDICVICMIVVEQSEAPKKVSSSGSSWQKQTRSENENNHENEEKFAGIRKDTTIPSRNIA